MDSASHRSPISLLFVLLSANSAWVSVSQEDADPTCLLQHGALQHQQQRQRQLTATMGLTEPLVDEVYTFGAPATKAEPFRNAAREDGCFPGLRSYNEDHIGSQKEITQVDAASIFTFYPHAYIATVVLHKGEDSDYTPCSRHFGHPSRPQRAPQVYSEWRLHDEDDYQERFDKITIKGESVVEKAPFALARHFIILAWKSYDTPEHKRKAIERYFPAWRLVYLDEDVHGDDTDPVMLVQDSTTLDCALVFTGTNSFSELTTSTMQYGTGYCGFEGVHAGYRNELWTLSSNLWPALRPKMEKCNRMTCVGHSLGGALCEIFAACANSGNTTDPDYKLLTWEKKRPELMPWA